MPTGFITAAREVLDLLERPPVDADEASRARVLLHRLAALQVEALALPDMSSDHHQVDGPPRRSLDLRWLPFRYYRNPFDPFDFTGEAEVGDLADDLLDIAHDLENGFAQRAAGDLAGAVWSWRFTYWLHWSEHLAGAVWALHRWLALRP